MRDNKERFIEKARKVHGGKYDYSKVKYVDSTTKVYIICPQHGEFHQTPQGHLRGNGCPLCSNQKKGRIPRLTTEEYVQRAREVHGDKYDYSKTVYRNSHEKICVTCPIHGDFLILPINHVYQQKQGCPKCTNRHLTTEDIINLFKGVHGNKYDYSKVEYTKMHAKVCIICPIHGEFHQTPSKHLLGQGCKKCGAVERARKRTKSTERFIEEAKEIHGDKYGYSKVNYVSSHGKVNIICPRHGEFSQRPYDHLHGHGCPVCVESQLEREVELFLIKNKVDYIKQCNQTTFKWLGKQSLDFYLPKYNVAIECQGIQHFEAIRFFGGEEEFEIIQERDKRKRKLCSDNGVKLLYFSTTNKKKLPYKVFKSKTELLENIKKS